MQILGFNFLISTLSGMWRPIEWSTAGVKLIYSIFSFFIIISLYFLLLTQFLDIVLVADSIDKIVQDSLLFVTICTVCCKATFTIKRRDAIYNLVRTLLSEPCKPQNEDEVAIQLKFDKFIRSCTIKYLFLAMGSVSSNILVSIPNIMDGILLYPVWLPYNSNIPWLFWLTVIQQIISILFATLINVSTETLIFGFILQICAQLEIFEYRLHKITTSKTVRCLSSTLSNSTRTLISSYICHHLKIYKYAKTVNRVFNEILFVQFFGSILVLCTTVYFISMNITTSDSVGLLIYSICMFVQIYIYCWSGNEVILKSSNIGNAVYDIDWTLLPVSLRKDLLMIMKRSTIPIKFTSSFLVTLSLQSYSNILKTSYTIFNVLQER